MRKRDMAALGAILFLGYAGVWLLSRTDILGSGITYRRRPPPRRNRRTSKSVIGRRRQFHTRPAVQSTHVLTSPSSTGPTKTNLSQSTSTWVHRSMTNIFRGIMTSVQRISLPQNWLFSPVRRRSSQLQHLEQKQQQRQQQNELQLEQEPLLPQQQQHPLLQQQPQRLQQLTPLQQLPPLQQQLPPLQQQQPPLQQQQPPLQQQLPPLQQQQPPLQQQQPPLQQHPLKLQQQLPPLQQQQPPLQQQLLPLQQQQPSLQQQLIPRQQQLPPLQQQQPTLHQKQPPLQQQLTPLQQQLPILQQQQPLLKQQLPPLQQQMPPLQQLPPLQQQMPRLQQQLPLLQQQLLPLQQQLPPLHQQLPPLQQQQPLLQQQLPPLQQLPPMQQHLPTLQQQQPPLQQEMSPLQQLPSLEQKPPLQQQLPQLQQELPPLQQPQSSLHQQLSPLQQELTPLQQQLSPLQQQQPPLQQHQPLLQQQQPPLQQQQPPLQQQQPPLQQQQPPPQQQQPPLQQQLLPLQKLPPLQQQPSPLQQQLPPLQQQQPQLQQQLPPLQQQQPPLQQQLPQQQQQQQPLHNITPEQTNAFRFLLIIDQVARQVLEKIFTFGAQNKNPTETLKDFLIKSKGMSSSKYRNVFNRTAREKIGQDPSCQSFDVSLWFQAIQWGCDNLANPNDSDAWSSSPDTIENHVKRIKDKRNNFMHSEIALTTPELYKQIELMRTLLIKTLELAKLKYLVDDSYMNQVCVDIHKDINVIRDIHLAQLDLKSYESLPLVKHLQRILETIGVDDLAKLFDKLSQVNPAGLMAGYNIHLKINLIYTSLEIVQGSGELENKPISDNNFLQYAHDLKQGPKSNRIQIIMFEGVAGVGKTTLIKLLLSDWTSGRISGNYSVKELDRYKFIILLECRNRSAPSLSSLIASLMPTARKHFQDKQHMMECLLDLPTMIIVDGLDEMNDISKEIFLHIVQLRNLDNVTIICTTRPEKLEDYYRMVPDDVSTVHIKITGVPESSKENFLVKYHEELRASGFSIQDTEGLLTYFRNTRGPLEEHWRLPLNLTLMSTLWGVDSSRVNCITTPIELMYQIQNLTKEKLLERLDKAELTKHVASPQLRKNVDVFLAGLSREAMLGIRDDTILLSEEALQRLRNLCDSLRLPTEEVMGAFLIQENSCSPTGVTTIVCFAHKTMQEFYACQYIYTEVVGDRESLDTNRKIKVTMDCLSVQDLPPDILSDFETFARCRRRLSIDRVTISSILDRLQEDANRDFDMKKYQNTLISLLGLFHLKGKDQDEVLVKEMIDLLRRAGVNNQGRWVTVLNSVKCNDTVAKLIAQLQGIMGGVISISDSNVFAFATLLRSNKAKVVNIKIWGDPLKIPRLDELLISIAQHRSEVHEFHLFHLFQNPTVNTPMIDCITQVMERCSQMKWYTGPMLKGLQRMTDMRASMISLTDTNSYRLLRDFLLDTQLKLRFLRICLPTTVDVQVIEPLPGYVYLELFIPGVRSQEGIRLACGIVKRLYPTTGKRKMFDDVYFPKAQLDQAGLRKLLEGLQGVTVRHSIVFPSHLRPLSTQDEADIAQVAKESCGQDVMVTWGKPPAFSAAGVCDLDSW